ncbi:MAG: twitch domain-containing radical SAM protein [Pseudobdellovibrio sp.]
MNKNETVFNFGQKLNEKFGPGFCAAKWKHLNLYLHLGQGHSCYHPPQEHIPLNEIKANPSALHNTANKINERGQMLEGQKPSGCSYCWDVEKLGDKSLSDRYLKNYEYTQGDFKKAEKVFNEALSPAVNPEYIEISFSNKCNFKCVYCNPKASSSWEEEIKKFGPYAELENNFAIDQAILPEENEYSKAFESWWPQIGSELKALRITGGEPLLHRKTFSVLESLARAPRPDLIIMLNSNLGVPTALVQKFIGHVQNIEKNKLCKSIKIFVSLESVGARAEYARHGLEYGLWQQNLRKILTEANCEVSLMSTYNLFAVTGFTEFLKMFLELRKEFCRNLKRIKIDIPYLVLPRMFHVALLGSEFKKYLAESIEFMEQNSSETSPWLFDSLEINLLKRIYEVWNSEPFSNDEKKALIRDFFKFQRESDRRRQTDFKKVFPEMADFRE